MSPAGHDVFDLQEARVEVGRGYRDALVPLKEDLVVHQLTAVGPF